MMIGASRLAAVGEDAGELGDSAWSRRPHCGQLCNRSRCRICQRQDPADDLLIEMKNEDRAL